MIDISDENKICEVCSGDIVLVPMDPNDKIHTMVWQCNSCNTVYNEVSISGVKKLKIEVDYDRIFD